LRQLASTLSTEGKLGEAEYFAKEGLRLTLAYSTSNTAPSSSAMVVLGAIKLQQGRIAEAERYLVAATQALEQSHVDPSSTLLARRRALLGLIYGMQGRWQDASRVFELRDQGLRSNPKQNAKFGSRNFDWAMVLMRTGQTAKAVDMLNRLLDYNLKKPYVNPLYVAYLRGYLAVALGDNGDDVQALKQFRLALPALLDGARDDTEAEDAGFIRNYRTRLILEGYLQLLGRLEGKGSVVDGIEARAEAFRVADIARNSSVQRAVTTSAARASISDPELAQLARSEQDVSSRIQALSKLLIRLVSANEERRLPKVIADIQKDLENLGIEHAELKKTITQRFPDYASLIEPRAPTPAEIQKVLSAEEAVIAIYCGDRQSYVWTITPSDIGFRIVPLTRAEIAGDVKSIRESLDLSDGKARDFDIAKAHELYAALLAPDAAKWGGAKMITVMPHAELGQLPFAVLLTSPVAPAKSRKAADYADMPWLIQKVAIAQQPSAASFLALRRPRTVLGEQLPFVGFGDPTFSKGGRVGSERGGLRSLQLVTQGDKILEAIENGTGVKGVASEASPVGSSPLAGAFSALPALPDTSVELLDIAKATGADRTRDLYLGVRATEANAKSADLARFHVIAFATHGLVPGDIVGLDEPALAMANPELSGDANNDGFLTLEEVLGLKLNADWVILSACNTASADGNAGEAVSGLGRAFFYAGARSLLVSNWAVETVSARLLTTGIFRQANGSPVRSRAEALRRSMLNVMRDSRYGHPAFWAPFTLVGDGMGQ
jgi:CHAT domain-containing protein